MKTVTAALILQDRRVLIARRGTDDRLAGQWEFPGGQLEEGETPEQCLERELQEELGIQSTVGDFVGENIHHYPHGSIRLLAYRASWQGETIEARVHQEVRWVAIDELAAYDFTPADLPFVEMLMRKPASGSGP